MIPRILLVEDEPNLREAIRMNLEMEGYEVVTASVGSKAVQIFREQRFNLVVLDVMIPEMNGFEVCEQIRLQNLDVPILFLTAKSSGQDKIIGLKMGADDYMTKPFNLEEFLLRVKVLVRHSMKGEAMNQDKTSFRFGENEVNFVTYEALGLQGKSVLSKREIMLLKLLIDRKNQVVSRQMILQHVWGYDVFPSTRTIDNYITAFRKYFEKDPRNPEFFHSIRGVGYKFTV